MSIIFKCKICGGSLEIDNAESVAVCEYCGTKQTVPTTKDEAVANLFNRANNLRLKCEFDKAEQVYEKILDIDNADAEAHWGLVLCKYGIEYVDDSKTNTKIPTCHRTLYGAVLTDIDYVAAIENSDAKQKELYEAEAKVIDELQKNILNIVNNEEPFDVFICYKETDDDGKRTVDSSISNDIYYQLTQEGFKVFYAPITLEDKLGYEYEPYIFAALNSAKVMLVVGTKPEYFDSVWVRNEWSRYLKLMKAERSKLLIPCYKDMDAYELPDEFAHLQAQDMGKIGFISDVIRGLNKVIKSNIIFETLQTSDIKSSSKNNQDIEVEKVLDKVFLLIEDKKWFFANRLCNKILKNDHTCAKAYLAKLMIQCHATKIYEIVKCKKSLKKNKYFQKARRFGSKDLILKLDRYAEIQSYIKKEMRLPLYSTINLGLMLLSFISFSLINKFYYNIYADNELVEIFIVAAPYLFTGIGILLLLISIARIYFIHLKKYRILRKRFDLNDTSKDEFERFVSLSTQKHQREKKINRIVFTTVSCLLVISVLMHSVTSMLKYNAAIRAMEESDVVSAYKGFVELNGYRDTEKYIREIGLQAQIEIIKQSDVGDVIYYGSYEQDNKETNGPEEIEWIVLEKEENKVFVTSKYALDNLSYYSFFDTKNGEYGWADCYLREWLNDYFMNRAFTKEQIDLISSCKIENKSYKFENFELSQKGTSYQDTTDKIFLLSREEVEKHFIPEELALKPTSYARTYTDYRWPREYHNCYWYIRDTYADLGREGILAHYSCGQLTDGYSYTRSFNNIPSYFVRPAMWIDVSGISD